MTVVRHADARRTTTPNGTMTTLASPTQGGSALAMWQVEAPPAGIGPLHTFDTELIWTITSGAVTVELDGAEHALAAGDTVVLPAGSSRRMRADPATGFTAIVAARGGAMASAAGAEPVLPGWVA